MYLNEKAWEIGQDNPYLTKEALKRFVQIYGALADEFNVSGIFVPEGEELYLRSTAYSLGKWLSETEIEYKRLYLTFWNKRLSYHTEDECEVTFENERMAGGTEAFLNDSFIISLCLDDKWKKEEITADFISLPDEIEEEVVIRNVFEKNHLYNDSIKEILKKERNIKLYSYRELWERRSDLFPHLKFCPSVEKDLETLERFYLNQIIKKLTELDHYCAVDDGTGFKPERLSKTTIESDSTLQKFKNQHTFTDQEGNEFLATWHMRFTGIPGRIFFVPEYGLNNILICRIGKKLPNATYPT